ncbi:MAG: YraN family protein [Defluviitaleaceae bacterium]|nr:YraN family protein [Defluviitaleaceae bacterium]
MPNETFNNFSNNRFAVNTQKTARRVGNYGESIAVEYLVKKGYQILARNYTRNKGEIDIIVKNDEYLIFVEVKYRSQINFGTPIEAVTRRKQKAIISCAYAYLGEMDLNDVACRFDIIEIFDNKQFGNTINHIKNAFGEA